ncbi:alkaline phosphatase [Saccharothrix sp. ALI-22-I]|uniref:alkaline phosphatase D family protein n=1 Tax=Saccharothrix sp. ALI-22-I TaxID=1933778 RepID=UPI00097C563B|nr:alkaline phosphatase D family protein [Saccharothrix sp. ALI-22-I]ONI87773.1 alkaline phosphatase [Saccharothrix sp. ALI-22-I]
MPNTHPRRDALRLGAFAGVALLAPALSAEVSNAEASTTHFRHGVASGDPLPERVVLWTRVTPTEDSAPGSGVGPTVVVTYEVAKDAQFRQVVRRGDVTTGPDRDHTVKLDVGGLRPGRWYFYRFTFDGRHSPVGRTRTAPAHHADVDQLRFGVVSCSSWVAGHFAAYRHLAERADLDAVVHLGDYLYEDYIGTQFRTHQPPGETVSLTDYRIRHAQYKTDPDLQRLHATYPWIITWDDHEWADNAWADGSPSHDETTEGTWAQRRAAAMRAYHEWMPVRLDGDRVYRRLRFGTLAELTMLDLRTYRSRQVDPAQVDQPGRTLTGPDQMAFLRDGLLNSGAQWKLIGNPVIFSPLLVPQLPQAGAVSQLVGPTINNDQWDGYPHDRDALIRLLDEHDVRDTVFLTGDVHSSWAFEVPVDEALYPLTKVVATELVVPSVTSDNIDELTGSPPRTTSLALEAALVGLNRHLKWVELDSHGYTVLDVRREHVRMNWYFLAERTDPNSAAALAKTVTVVSGTQRIG